MKTIALTWSLFALIFCASIAEAAKIISVKNNKALVDLEGESLPVGTMLMARDSGGARKAILEIRQVKNNRAIAVLKKGSVQQAYSLEVYTKGGGAASTAAISGGSSKFGKTTAGVLAGYSMNSMNVKFSSSSTTLTGSSFNLAGFYRRELDDNIFVRGLVGYETLTASGDYNVDISYLGLQAQIEYQFINASTWQFWAGGGLGFLYALSKQSNVLDTSKISTNQTLIGALGVNYRLNRNSYVPIQLSYSIFPDNQTSSASQIIIRAGYSWDF